MSRCLQKRVIQRRAAPTIWTPSVPRCKPSPRPPFNPSQEERGRGTFVISFVTLSIRTARLQSKQLKHQLVEQQASSNLNSEDMARECCNIEYISKDSRLQSGQLLKGMETGVQFPLVHISGVVPDNQRVAEQAFLAEADTPVLEWVLQRGVFDEVVSWMPELLVPCPSDPSLMVRCFILLGFRTLEGTMDKHMEYQWRDWTGAMYIYHNVPDDLGLKRLSFYRRRSRPHPAIFTYLVVVELDTITPENVIHMLDFVHRMKMRNMNGYISVYQELQREVFRSGVSKGAESRPGSPLLDLNRVSI